MVKPLVDLQKIVLRTSLKVVDEAGEVFRRPKQNFAQGLCIYQHAALYPAVQRRNHQPVVAGSAAKPMVSYQICFTVYGKVMENEPFNGGVSMEILLLTFLDDKKFGNFSMIKWSFLSFTTPVPSVHINLNDDVKTKPGFRESRNLEAFTCGDG